MDVLNDLSPFLLIYTYIRILYPYEHCVNNCDNNHIEIISSVIYIRFAIALSLIVYLLARFIDIVGLSTRKSDVHTLNCVYTWFYQRVIGLNEDSVLLSGCLFHDRMVNQYEIRYAF